MYQIAIVVIGYNRIDSISRLMDSLLVAKYPHNNVPLIISVDKSNTTMVENYADSFEWKYGEKIVVKHTQQQGLRKHIISQGRWFNKYDALIILEDDLTVSPNFYTYASLCVNKYFNDANIAGISLFSFGVNYQNTKLFTPIKDENDVYFMNCAQSWGEIWMRNQWQAFYDWYCDNSDFPQVSDILPRRLCEWKASSWLKYHSRYCIENDKYFVYPYVSYSTNNGDAGTHSKVPYINVNQERLQMGTISELQLPDFASNDVICYDGFFENKDLYKYLGVPYKDCCVDIYGEKNNRCHQRYWLTTRRLNYKILKSFGIRYRPIDQNVISATPGSDLFLYDTTVTNKNAFKKSLFSHILYDSRQLWMTQIMKMFGMGNVAKEVWQRLKSKI